MAVSTAIDPSAIARVVGIKTAFKDLRAGNVLFLPQRVVLLGQGSTLSSYATTKKQVFSAAEVGETYGYGSPLHLSALQLLPVNGDGIGSIPLTVYPLEDDVAGAESSGDITPTMTPTGTSNYIVRINNIDSKGIVVELGDAPADFITKAIAAINAVLAMPVIASDGTTKLDLDAKWAGASGDDITVELIEVVPDTGNTFVITQPTGGLNNPTVDAALAQIGNVWESMIVNCLEKADTTALDAYSTFGEGRWLPTTRKPLMVFTGDNTTSVVTAIVLPESRKTDRVNIQIPEPGGKDLPCVIAARAVARIVRVANSIPSHDYGSQQATGLTPGVDGDQWDEAEREAAVQGGSSTIQVKDGVVNLSDTVTFYHPTGEPIPPYRYVVDIVKLQQVIFNTALIFENAEWDGAALIPDEQATVERTAKKPKAAVTAIASMLDSLGLNAIISDPETAKNTIVAVINDGNPKRLDVAFTVQLSGNSNVISVDLNFGFFFGTSPVIA